MANSIKQFNRGQHLTAILKVAELVGGIGLGTGFRSANRSVAGRASPALWGWGSALAGNPGLGQRPFLEQRLQQRGPVRAIDVLGQGLHVPGRNRAA